MKDQYFILTLFFILTGCSRHLQARFLVCKHPPNIPTPLLNVNIDNANKQRAGAQKRAPPPRTIPEGNNSSDNLDSLEKNLDQSVLCLKQQLKRHPNEFFNFQYYQNLCNLEIYDLSGAEKPSTPINYQLIGVGDEECKKATLCKVIKIPRLGKKKVCSSQSVCDCHICHCCSKIAPFDKLIHNTMLNNFYRKDN